MGSKEPQDASWLLCEESIEEEEEQGRADRSLQVGPSSTSSFTSMQHHLAPPGGQPELSFREWITEEGVQGLSLSEFEMQVSAQGDPSSVHQHAQASPSESNPLRTSGNRTQSEQLTAQDPAPQDVHQNAAEGEPAVNPTAAALPDENQVNEQQERMNERLKGTKRKRN